MSFRVVRSQLHRLPQLRQSLVILSLDFIRDAALDVGLYIPHSPVALPFQVSFTDNVCDITEIS
jgi:hypothetical protein